MLGRKVRNPVVALMMGLAVMVGLFVMMEQLLQRSSPVEEEVLPVPGRSPLPEEWTSPFADRWGAVSGNVRESALKEISAWLEEQGREDMLGFLLPGVEPRHLRRAPSRYVGRWVPMRLPDSGKEMSRKDAGLQWIKFDLEGGPLVLGIANYHFSLEDRPLYVEMISLGLDKEHPTALLGLTSKVYELPDKGEYPMMESDRIALMEVVDELENPRLHKMTRNISPRVLSHYFGKVQKNEFADEEVVPMRYSELMESPDVFRGEWTEFTGRLLYRQRRLLSAQGLPPGLDFYEEGYLLNSDRVPVVFRTPRLGPEYEVNDIVRVEGFFLQRYNFRNRLNQATWAPMIIAGKVTELQEKEFGLTKIESWVVGSVIALGVAGMLWFLLRPTPPRQTIRAKRGELRPRGQGKKQGEIDL